MTFRTRLLPALVAALAMAMPVAVFAQSDDQAPPPPTAAGPAPSYARPSYATNEDQIRGQIVSFDGGYNLRVRDEHGYVDAVTLHQGTIINPTGLRLSPGMSVTVRGVNRGGYLDAYQIDTPYNTYGATYAYPAPYPYPYAYPAYGYPVPYAYPYAPSLSIGIGFGGYWGRGRWR